MFGSQILEVGIGLVFIYFIFSLITSAITEAISNILALRAKTLEKGLLNLLEQKQEDQDKNSSADNKLADKFFEHGLIKNLGRPSRTNPKGLPSYLPANRFAYVLLDSIVNLDVGHAQDRVKLTVDEINHSIEKINNPAIAQALLGIIDEVDDEIEAGVIQAAERLIAIRKKVENWYDEMMERVSGWYKRSAQKIIFVVAFLIAFAMNVDTLMVTSVLWNAPAIRAAVASSANETVTIINSAPGESGSEAVSPAIENPPSDSTGQDFNISLSELQDNQIIGWSPAGSGDTRALPASFGAWILKVIGLTATAFALTLGSPFWFELLSKLVSLRGSGKNPAEQEDQDSRTSTPAEALSIDPDKKAANRELNLLRGQVESLKVNLRNQFIDIIVDKISDNGRLLTLFNFTHRDLTPMEKQECKAVFGNEVDYEDVKIFEGNALPNFLDDIGRLIKDMPMREQGAKNAITLGNCCFFGRELLTRNISDTTKKLDNAQVNDMCWLIHELTHVWQFQSGGWGYLWEAWDAQREQKADAYKYGGESGLRRRRNEGRRFYSFNPEQQGQITRDYYKRLKQNEELRLSGKEQLDISAYEHFIAEISLVKA